MTSPGHWPAPRRSPADPGWGGPRGVALALVPFVSPSMIGRAGNQLVLLRNLFLRFCSMIVLVGVVVLILGTDSSDDAPIDLAPALAVIAVIGIVMVLTTEWLARRPLDCASPAALVGSYRTRFFIRLALGEVSALAGFIALFVVNSQVPYFVGAAFTAIVFARVAPTRAHLARDQAALRHRKCDLELVAVLGGA